MHATLTASPELDVVRFCSIPSSRRKGAQFAASVRFRVDIEDVPLHFRLLLLRSDAPLVARALATLPQV